MYTYMDRHRGQAWQAPLLLEALSRKSIGCRFALFAGAAVCSTAVPASARAGCTSTVPWTVLLPRARCTVKATAISNQQVSVPLNLEDPPSDIIRLCTCRNTAQASTVTPYMPNAISRHACRSLKTDQGFDKTRGVTTAFAEHKVDRYTVVHLGSAGS